MGVISLCEKNSEIIHFIEKNNLHIPEELQEHLFDFMTKICSYEEEEKKIYPHLVLGHNIESEGFSKIFPIEIIHLSCERDKSLFYKRLKPLLSFCNNGWRVYVDVTEEELNFGIMRSFSGIEGLIVDDLIKNSKETADMIYNDYQISCVLLNPINMSTFEIVGMNGDELKINFSLSKKVESNVEQKKLFLDDILKCTNDDRIRRSFKKIIDLFPQKLHGAICLVVNENCQLPNEQLKDGIFFEQPIDMAKTAKEILDKGINHTTDYIRQLDEKYYAITGLFIEMLNIDGITIVDTKGRIRGYNVFITPQNNDNIIAGGARKRAAYALLESKEEGYVGIYFQSQDGNYFYERMRGLL